jgi:hypothetical protein
MNRPEPFITDEISGVKVSNPLCKAWSDGYQQRVSERREVDKLQDELVKNLDTELRGIRAKMKLEELAQKLYEEDGHCGNLYKKASSNQLRFYENKALQSDEYIKSLPINTEVF